MWEVGGAQSSPVAAQTLLWLSSSGASTVSSGLGLGFSTIPTDQQHTLSLLLHDVPMGADLICALMAPHEVPHSPLPFLTCLGVWLHVMCPLSLTFESVSGT